MTNKNTKLQEKFERRGTFAESKVSIFLSKVADKNNGYLINDIMVPDTNSGNCSQIDHIYIDRRGVFVIETKHRVGYIFGNENDVNWTQALGGKKNISFYNPYIQNLTHLRRVKDILGIDSEKIIGYVVFVGDECYLTHVHCPNTYRYNVFRIYFQRNEKEILSDEECDSIYKRLMFFKEHPLESQEEHVIKVKKITHKN